jgi:hypothetical protein
MTGWIAAGILLLIGCLLYFISWKGYIQNSTLDRLDKIASVLSFLTAIVVLVWSTTSFNGSFTYEVRVQEHGSLNPVKDAKVILESGSTFVPKIEFTDSEGIARIFIDSSRGGKPGKVIVEAAGYKTYVQNVDLTETELPQVIELEIIPSQ